MNFFIMNKFIGPKNYKPIYKSETKESRNGRFEWNFVSLLTSEMANEEEEREVRVEFFKSSKTGQHQNLGFADFTISQLKDGTDSFDLQGRSKGAKMLFTRLNFSHRHTFLEYVFGGCEIQLTVAIDFTLSNGNPADKDSLHYLDLSKNEYLQAIRSVGEVLQYYDSDKQIPCLGFGACIPPAQNRASHCFALNGDIFDPECDGLEGVLEAYKSAIKTVNLYGPTNFAPIVELVCDMAEEEKVTQAHQKYFILLIITDGIINDMQKTIDQIVRGSTLPLSIIIVGVGSDEFANMDILDADETPLYSQRYKKYMEADIVQFVPFRDFRTNPIELAKQTLEEVPRQLLNYFRTQRIVPMPATEESRRKIQQKLSMQTSLGGHQKPEDFFARRKEKFLMKMTDLGYDIMAVTDFLEEKGLFEENVELVIDHLNNPAFENTLKRGY